MTTAPSLKNLGFTGPEPMRASDRPRTLYAGTGTLNELVGVAVRASLAFARVSGGMGASPRSRYGGVHLPHGFDNRRGVYDGVDRLEESTAPGHSPIHHRGSEGRPEMAPPQHSRRK
jgi:hypothetical protein